MSVSMDPLEQFKLNQLMRPPMVCSCRRVPESAIRDAIQKEGARDFDAVQAITHCTTGCGTCQEAVERVMAKYLPA